MSDLFEAIKLISRSNPASILREAPSALTIRAAAAALTKSLEYDAPMSCCGNAVTPGDRCKTCGDKY